MTSKRRPKTKKGKKQMKPNFTGWATKYGVLCSDGRTIQANAFAHEHGKKIPLLWRHEDHSATNILGHVILEHVDGVGVRAKGYLNETPHGEHSRGMIEHGDITALSIKAVRLQQQGSNVMRGDLVHVGLVENGANGEARIDSVTMQHEDGYPVELEHEAIIYTGEGLELTHEDDSDEDESLEQEGKTLKEVYDAMTDEQKLVVAALINEAQGAEHEDSESENLEHEGETMSRNVFDQEKNPKNKELSNVLTHEQQVELLNEAASSGSLAKFFSNMEKELAHDGMAAPYGITNIEELFPDYKDVQERPEWIKRDTEWVAKVLGGVSHKPYTRIKSRSADITHEEARAKGYIKGNLKKRQYFEIASRTTDAKTVYKAQGFDRDDLIDIDFDVVAWVKEEMRGQLREEIARAILFGDNRPEEDPQNPGQPNPDKIDETKIRPIATDEDFYTAKVMIGTGRSAKDLLKIILRSRKLRRGGTGRATLFTTDDLVVDMLLMEDKLGRRYYETEAALAAALGVSSIVSVEVLEEGYADDDGNRLMGVLVNLSDYDFGRKRAGQETMFEDFDIDYNQMKYLIETRASGALTRHRSAVSLWETAGTEVFPVAPTQDGADVTIPSVTGVNYFQHSGTNDPEPASGTVTIPTGEMLYITAEPDEGYYFPNNVTSDWIFEE